jgi:hypothetical protein
MELINLWRRKLIVFLLFFILLVGTSKPVLSYTLVFREDFSNPQSTGWETSALEWCQLPDEVIIVNGLNTTGFEIQNGEMVSLGLDPDFNTSCDFQSMFMFNVAIHSNNIEYGIWSFDYYQDVYDSGWLFWVIDDLDQGGKDPSDYNHTGVLIIDSPSTIIFHYGVGVNSNNFEEGKAFNANSTGFEYQYEQWHHINIVRNPNGFAVYIDSNLRYNYDLGEYYSFDQNYLAIGAPVGSLSRFDNFTISDADDNSDSTLNLGRTWEIIFFGGSLGLITTYYTWTIGKKNF